MTPDIDDNVWDRSDVWFCLRNKRLEITKYLQLKEKPAIPWKKTLFNYPWKLLKFI